MLPADVLASRKITPTAKLVFQAMAMEAFGLGELAISHQSLARICGSARCTVLLALQKLEEVGLIEKSGEPEKQVQPYRLLHPRFAFGAVSDAESPRKKPAQLAACSKCTALCKPGAIGLCRNCRLDARMERTARRVVHEELDQAGVA